MARKHHVRGQISLLTGELEDLTVEVVEVEEDRGAVAVRSMQDPMRYATFIERSTKPHKVSGWLTPPEFNDAVKVVTAIFFEAKRTGRFS